jgi:hypothetical protein
LTPHEEMWAEYKEFTAQVLPEPVWQFSRERYRWAKDQWPNLSDRLTTVWTLQELNLLPDNIDVRTVIAVANGNKLKRVSLSTKTVEDDTLLEVSKEDFEIPEPDNGIIETGGEVRIPKDTNAKASPSDTPSDEKG